MLMATLLATGIRTGSLTVIDAHGGRHVFGDGMLPAATIRLHDARLHRAVFFDPWLKLGEAYMDGTMTVEDGSLDDVVEIATINAKVLGGHPVRRFAKAFARVSRWWQQRNPIGRARRHVAHHYDLSQELFSLFLDRDLHYSCGYFAAPETGLEEAQRAKCRHIAAKLLLEPGQRVLDIGSGWGSLALYLARTANVEVLGLTLSAEQRAVAQERATAAGLAGRVAFDLRDYREQSGRFDRIVSVGMFEHVGVRHYPEFFGRSFLAAWCGCCGRMAWPSCTASVAAKVPASPTRGYANTFFRVAIPRPCRRCCPRSSVPACGSPTSRYCACTMPKP